MRDRTGEVWQRHRMTPFLVYRSEEDAHGNLVHYVFSVCEHSDYAMSRHGLPFQVEREWGGSDRWETMPLYFRRLA